MFFYRSLSTEGSVEERPGSDLRFINIICQIKLYYKKKLFKLYYLI